MTSLRFDGLVVKHGKLVIKVLKHGEIYQLGKVTANPHTNITYIFIPQH